MIIALNFASLNLMTNIQQKLLKSNIALTKMEFWYPLHLMVQLEHMIQLDLSVSEL